MADATESLDDASVEKRPIKCKICSKFVSQSDVKCLGECCNTVLHLKCFDTLAKIVDIDKKSFRCKNCSGSQVNHDQSQLCSGSSDIIIQEIECLQREKDLLKKWAAEMEFSNSLLKDKLRVCEQDPVSKNLTFLSIADDNATASYSSVAGKNVNKTSAVLLVKSNDRSTTNKQIEKDIKSKINPGSVNANVLNTKLIKNGLLINCGDNNSLTALKNCLNQEVGEMYNVTEPRRLNPRIIVYSVESSAAECPNILLKT